MSPLRTDDDDAIAPEPRGRRAVVRLDAPADVAYWTRLLACTEEELREAVRAVGRWWLAVRDHVVVMREVHIG